MVTEKEKEDAWFGLAERTVGFLKFLRIDNPAFDTIYIQAQKQLECVRQDRNRKNYQDVPV